MSGPGAVVEYVQARKLKLALCLRSDSKGILHVRTQENREEKVHPGKVLFSHASVLDPEAPREEVVQKLREEDARREAIAAGIPLGELWELLEGESPTGYELRELAELYYGGGFGTEELSGLYRALEADVVWFQRKGDAYVLRPPELVEETLTRLRVEAAREREKEELVRWLRRLWQAPEGAPPPQPAAEVQESARRYLTWIRDCALHGAESRRFKEVSALMAEAGISRKDAPFRLLVKAGLWTEHENLDLHRHQVSSEFSQELTAEAEALAREAAPLSDPLREDLRHLDCITIDDERTTEIDDALSLEETDGVLRVGVHISDASAYVVERSALDVEARARATAIYLPDRKIRMLPPPLSEEACSLVEGGDRPALSFLAEFGPDRTLRSARLASSVVRVRQRHTYPSSEPLFAEGGRMRALYDLALALREARRAAGAVTVPLPRLEIRVADDGTVEIGRESVTAPSQVVVSEMMILANRIAAEHLLSQRAPAVFRSQPAPDRPIEDQAEFDPVQAFLARRLMRKGEVGTKPSRHHGLGLDAYTQVTSPIRRYVDLVMQRQLKSVLAGGEPRHTEAELEEVLLATRPTLQLVERMERERRNYWLMVHLERRTHEELDAVVVQNLPDKHLVQLEELLLETHCAHVPGRPLPPGTRIRVRVELVWPRDQVVRVTPVLPED